MPHLLDGLRILVLEDEFLIAMDVEQLCRDHGAGEVVVARDLAEIDDRKIATQFDAAIVDLMLGGTSTLEFAAGLRETGVPFVFASGYSDADEIKASFPGCGWSPNPIQAKISSKRSRWPMDVALPDETDAAASASRCPDLALMRRRPRDLSRDRIGTIFVLARNLQDFLQARAGPADAALDRSDRATADFGGLLIGEA